MTTPRPRRPITPHTVTEVTLRRAMRTSTPHQVAQLLRRYDRQQNGHHA